MELDVEHVEDREIRFVIEDVDHAFVNALRRTLLSDVPSLAVEDVTIYDNTSVLFDEILAHRIGLLPIPTDPESMVLQEECDCGGEGCAECTVLYTMSKEGPGTVRSEDLTATQGDFEVADPDVPLVRLEEGQRVMLEATAILGTGDTHSKWTPAHGVGYRELPEVEIDDDPDLLPNTIEDLQQQAVDAVTVDGDGGIEVQERDAAYDWLRSVKDKHDLDHVHLDTRDDAFVFSFETDGSLTAKEALDAAVDVLVEKLEAVEEAAPELVEA
jgi:DNA-directed RNA polymerase subunit D